MVDDDGKFCFNVCIYLGGELKAHLDPFTDDIPIEFQFAFQKVLVLTTFSPPRPPPFPLYPVQPHLHLYIEIIMSILQNKRVSCAGCYEATCLAQNLNYFNNW